MARGRSLILAALCLLPAVFWPRAGVLSAQVPASNSAFSIRITSPLGRTGVAGTVRIVAQVRPANQAPPPTVRVLVDGKLIQTITAPPYAVDWVDDDPLVEREIVVDASDAEGRTARDSITLKPFAVIDESEVTALVVEASVYNKKGRFVPGLGPTDFMLREDGQLQTLDLANQQSIPVTFALLIDSSQSMGYNLEFVRSASRRLSNYMRPNDRVIVAPFTTGLLPITGPTDDQATMLQAIGKVTNGGGTAILDSLRELADRMTNLEGRRAIVLVTDGYDENSVGTIEDTLKALQQAQTTVYVVGIGGIAGISLKGEAIMKRLAAETGGRTFFPWRLEDLTEVYDSLAVDVQTRYLIAYTPSNTARDGKWRTIEISTKSGDSVVQTRSGYFAMLPPPIHPTIEFTLTDGDQKYFDVTMDDLVVLENGVEQKIESFSEAVSPVSVVLALDSSGSVRTAAPLVMEAARGFVRALRDKDALAVLMFADKAILMQDLSTSRDLSLDAIDQYKAVGGTALYDAVADSFVRLMREEGRRAVVVVTDGRDEDNPGTGPGSVRKFDDVLRLQKESGAVVFGVGVGARVDRAPLETLAKVSGGQAYFPADASELPQQYQRIVEALRRRFAVSYTSTDETRDGAWRTVEIRVRSSNLLVSSAGGYFAPKR